MKKLINKFYLVGIKGNGMSSLAICLSDLGYYVTGSDVRKYYNTEDILRERNIEIKVFNKNNIISDEYIYIASSCYKDEHEEIKKIKNKGYTLYYYHQFLNYFFKGVKIGISGTHGKTTVTKFIADNFAEDASFIIGDGTGKGVKNYKYFIFEACEYQNKFLSYDYDFLVINNIELDHVDFFKNISDIYDSFIKASEKSKCLIINEDIDIEHNNKYTFGKKETSFSRYKIINETEEGYILDLKVGDINEIVRFPFCGEHMIYNMLAALTVLYLNDKIININDAIRNMSLPKKRMEVTYIKGNTVVTDYGHHPTEIKALLESLKQKFKDKKIFVFFQPHTYSRTIALKEEFKVCFDKADEVYIDKTFASEREEYSDQKEHEIEEIFIEYKKFNKDILYKYREQKNNVLVFLGAGTIDEYKKILY